MPAREHDDDMPWFMHPLVTGALVVASMASFAVSVKCFRELFRGNS